MKKLVLIGAGGHAHSCIDVIEQENKYKIIGLLDVREKIAQVVLGYSIIDCDENIEKYISSEIYFLISLGQIKTAEKRKTLFDVLQKKNAQVATIISPFAYVSPHACIDVGTIVMHHAIVNANAKIGKNCILNTNCLLEHDVTICDGCHISTSATVNGNVVIGENTFVGSNATVVQSVCVPANSFIKAGSLIK